MQSTHDLPLFQKSYDTYKNLHNLIKKYPKNEHYSLGEKSERLCLDIIEEIIIAGRSKREWKIPSIEKALTKSELLKVFVRLAYETHCINEKQYLRVESSFQEIGRMLGGWKRSI